MLNPGQTGLHGLHPSHQGPPRSLHFPSPPMYRFTVCEECPPILAPCEPGQAAWRQDVGAMYPFSYAFFPEIISAPLI